jgi:hypothetical protein
MTRADIIEMQTRIGTTPDGFWGPKSITACQKHLRALMPKQNPWPDTSQAALTKFYGRAGDERQLVLMPAPVAVYYEGKRLKNILCHKKVAPSLERILKAIAASPDAHLLTAWEGCYFNRPMRGGSLPSLHARGAAADIDAANNGNQVAWPVRARMPLEVMEIFAREGWVAAGAFWGRDGMHFQATR